MAKLTEYLVRGAYEHGQSLFLTAAAGNAAVSGHMLTASYMGEWWTPSGFDIAKVSELWLVEGIFDAIALWSVGIQAAALLSCNNYPSVALRTVADEQHAESVQYVANMATARQLVVNADHPLVQEFWDAYAYLNGDDNMSPQLNHSCDEEVIAVNLNQFIEVASAHRQQVPALRDLKKVLRTSRQYKFLEVKTVKSRIRQNSS